MAQAFQKGVRAYGGDGRRHTSPAIDTARTYGLKPEHPAIIEGRTLFPSTVVGPLASPRMLVSGDNNSKLGKRVLKGPWKGMPIYQLTLEERKTCPASCPVWNDCYGNALHLARRHDAFDEDFHLALWSEVVTLYRAVMNERAAPPGLVVRLHVLGDFTSARYVAIWADLLEKLPGLHVFGFTARRPDADDQDSRDTFAAIKALTDTQWDRFAIRWSREAPAAQGSVVVDTASSDPDVVMCPAQTEKTTSCASCGLCWAAAAREKTIGFLRHGRKSAGPRVVEPEEFAVVWRQGRRSSLTTVGSDAWWRQAGF